MSYFSKVNIYVKEYPIEDIVTDHQSLSDIQKHQYSFLYKGYFHIQGVMFEILEELQKLNLIDTVVKNPHTKLGWEDVLWERSQKNLHLVDKNDGYGSLNKKPSERFISTSVDEVKQAIEKHEEKDNE